MSRYDHKIETSLEGIEHLSKEKKEKERRKMKEKNHYYAILILKISEDDFCDLKMEGNIGNLIQDQTIIGILS